MPGPFILKQALGNPPDVNECVLYEIFMALVCYLDIVHHVGIFKHNIFHTGPVFVIPYSGRKASYLVGPDNKTENGPL